MYTRRKDQTYRAFCVNCDEEDNLSLDFYSHQAIINDLCPSSYSELPVLKLSLTCRYFFIYMDVSKLL